ESPLASKPLLDVQYIRENLEAVKQNCKNRNVTPDADRLVQLDHQRKPLVPAAQAKRQRANEVSRLIPTENDAAKKQSLIHARRRAARAGPGAVRVRHADPARLHADHHAGHGAGRRSRGIGFMPRGPETQIYSIANSDLCLIATAEITLGGMHRDRVVDELD